MNGISLRFRIAPVGVANLATRAAKPQREALSLPHRGISDYFSSAAISFPSRVKATAAFLWVRL